MKYAFLVFSMLTLRAAVFSQYVYTIRADSVKITSNNDSAELILENHTRGIPGFLFNTGNGRTAFKRALQKVNDTLYLVGSDSLRLPSNVLSAWVQGGNSFGATGVLGTKDNRHLDFYTNNTRRARLDSLGNLLLGFTTATNGYKLDVNGGARIYCPGWYLNVTTEDPTYHIVSFPAYTNGWNPGVDASLIAFGNLLGSIGINKQTLGNIPGFLFNNGNGRTIFKRALKKINDTVYLLASDTLKLHKVSNAWLQGGNSFGTTGVLGTKDNRHLDFYTNNTRRARLDSLGNLLLGFTAASGYKLDVDGGARILGDFTVSSGDSYNISYNPSYINGWSTSVDASMITFGNDIATIGINKQALGNIPESSLIIGKTSPGKVTAFVDYSSNPLVIANGDGSFTINGGFYGISTGGTVDVTANSTPISLKINGARGTGAGNTGDIIFSTDSSVSSGTAIHPMVNRWRIKGGKGYLSNTSNPSSVLDISGVNGYSQLGLRTSYTPSSSSDANGNTGNLNWDGDYFYIKTPSGWKRSALSSF